LKTEKSIPNEKVDQTGFDADAFAGTNWAHVSDEKKV